MKKLTQKDFKKFKKHCQYYIEKFNLKDWEVRYEFKRLKENEAECGRDLDTRIINLRLSTLVNKETKMEELAKHECLHILLSPLRIMADTRYTEWKAIHTEEERLVVLLEKLL